MIVIRLIGGLGNQMFQYALGMHLAEKNGAELKIDTTLLDDRSQPDVLVTHRQLDIDILQVNPVFATPQEIEHFNGKIYRHLPGKIYNQLQWQLIRKQKLIREQKRNFQPEILNLPDDRCLVGAWQSEKYFKAIEAKVRKTYAFREALSGKALVLSKEISSCNSLCINVRRGDYVSSPLYSKTLGAMPVEYFSKGYELMRSRQNIEHTYVFTDDQKWARENLNFSAATTFVGPEYNGPRYANKLELMACCRHFIIPNSSFSWWAAWLSNHPAKTVIAPLQWFKDPGMDASDLVPDTWIRI
jgi:hypothetical protein